MSPGSDGPRFDRPLLAVAGLIAGWLLVVDAALLLG